MTRDELTQAALAGLHICLDCAHTFEPDDPEEELTCPSCGQDAVYEASFVQRFMRMVGPSEGEDS